MAKEMSEGEKAISVGGWDLGGSCCSVAGEAILGFLKLMV